jgi:uncharacterized protein YbjT (DUF2867 family)
MTVCVVGSTGCVGRTLVPFLQGRGHRVRRGMRRPDGGADAVVLDLDDEATLRPALAGCDRAVFLVHGLARGAGYDVWESRTATAFAHACSDVGVRRIVYVGGVVPTTPASTVVGRSGLVSQHLQSRVRTGALLRSEAMDVEVVELRAGMIVAADSASFVLARDLAARLPVIVRPPWLRSRQRPVALTDVCAAIDHALGGVAGVHGVAPGIYTCAGPDTVGGDEVLVALGRLQGLRSRIVDVPAVSHGLVAGVLGRFTRASGDVVRELVMGMTDDLLGTDPDIFDTMPGHRRLSFDEAARRALRTENSRVTFNAAVAERALQLLSRRRR